MKIATLILLQLLFMAVVVDAAQPLAQSYYNETASLLERLRQNKVGVLGCNVSRCFTLQEVLIKLKKVEFVEADGLEKPVGATRFMAFYSVAEQRIYLNRDVDHPLDLRGYLGFHELMGLLGLGETEYQLTVPVIVLDKILTGNLKRKNPRTDILFLHSLLRGQKDTFLGRYETTPISQANAGLGRTMWRGGGSITVVAGGGDGVALALRAEVISLLATSNQRCTGREATEIPIGLLFKFNFPIEVTDTADVTPTYITSRKEDPWPRHILVPRKLQQNGMAAGDILKYMNSLRTFSAIPCQNKPAWNLLEAQIPKSYFYYPADESSLHPAMLEKTLKPLRDRLCQVGGCRTLSLKEKLLKEVFWSEGRP